MIPKYIYLFETELDRILIGLFCQIIYQINFPLSTINTHSSFGW